MITVIALPAIWLANRDDGQRSSSRPNVAAVGLDPGQADASAASSTVTDAIDPLGDAGAMYLQPVETGQPAPTYAIVVGTTPDVVIAATRASYSRSVPGGTCRYGGVRSGESITVVDVASGREVRCTVSRTEAKDSTLVMNPSLFAKIADLTAAPIHVEIRQ